MAKLYYATVSKIDYDKGFADITITEHEDQVIKDVPFLATFYDMPQVGDRVAALLEYDGGDYDKGAILGTFYTPKKNKPKDDYKGKGIYAKVFGDGKAIKYDQNEEKMKITVKEIWAKKLIYKETEQKDWE